MAAALSVLFCVGRCCFALVDVVVYYLMVGIA